MQPARTLGQLLGGLGCSPAGVWTQGPACAASLLARMCSTATSSTSSGSTCLPPVDMGCRSGAGRRAWPHATPLAPNSCSLHDVLPSRTIGSVQHHPGLHRHFSSSTAPLPDTAPAQGAPVSANTASSSQGPADLPRQAAAWPVWDWQYVTGGSLGRKPAIKRPRRHQWLFCNPNYDASQPLPPKILTPHAPTTAQQQDEWRVYNQLRPTHRQRSNRRMRQAFMRWLALRDVDWRNAFTKGLAADVKAAKKQERQQLRLRRQEAWLAFKQSLLADNAAQTGSTSRQAGASSRKSSGQQNSA